MARPLFSPAIPFFFLALILLPGAPPWDLRAEGNPGLFALDGRGPCALLVFRPGPHLSGKRGTMSGKLVNLAYPLGDLCLLFGLTVALVYRRCHWPCGPVAADRGGLLFGDRRFLGCRRALVSRTLLCHRTSFRSVLDGLLPTGAGDRIGGTPPQAAQASRCRRDAGECTGAPTACALRPPRSAPFPFSLCRCVTGQRGDRRARHH